MENSSDSREARIEPKLRIAGMLVLAGMLVEAFSLHWNSPMSFIVFLGIGCLLLFIGIVVYLLSLVQT